MKKLDVRMNWRSYSIASRLLPTMWLILVSQCEPYYLSPLTCSLCSSRSLLHLAKDLSSTSKINRHFNYRLSNLLPRQFVGTEIIYSLGWKLRHCSNKPIKHLYIASQESAHQFEL